MNASESRLCARWNNFAYIEPNNLTCEIYNYIGPVSTFKIHTAFDLFKTGELVRYQCPKCDLICDFAIRFCRN